MLQALSPRRLRPLARSAARRRPTAHDVEAVIAVFDAAERGDRELDLIFAWAMQGAMPRIGACAENGAPLPAASGELPHYTTHYGALAEAICGPDWRLRTVAADLAPGAILAICRSVLRARLLAMVDEGEEC
jgi:hypothetical protein